MRALAERGEVSVIFLAGDGKTDPELNYLSSFDAEHCATLASYLDAGGLDNALGFLAAVSDLINNTDYAPPVRPLMRAGLYWPGHVDVDFDQIRRQWRGAPVAALVFYRALMQAGDVAPIDCRFMRFGRGHERVAAVWRKSERNRNGSDYCRFYGKGRC